MAIELRGPDGEVRGPATRIAVVHAGAADFGYLRNKPGSNPRVKDSRLGSLVHNGRRRSVVVERKRQSQCAANDERAALDTADPARHVVGRACGVVR
jgi:hypothetical protein